MSQLRIALGQMDIALGRPDINLATARELAAEAAGRQAEVLVLPELWSTAYDLKNAAGHATPLDQGIFSETAALAREFQLHIVGSCLSYLEPGQYGNTAIWIDQFGQARGNYTKLHLFRLMAEEQFLEGGSSETVIDFPWGRVGLAICYDLRFPELFRMYALAGAELVVLPAEWPHPRLTHWRTLLKARAIENQFYIVACNRVGTTGQDVFFGHSAIVDPWGETIIEGEEDADLLVATIDLDAVDRARSKIPILADRRPDIYGLRKESSA